MDKTCKYYKYQKYVSYDNGATWQPLNQFQRGELIEFNSPDCGASVEALYRWEVIEGEFDCDGFDKYQKTQKYVSYDNGVTYSAVTPYEYGMGALLEHNSVDCGYVVIYDKYRWVDTEDIVCIEEEDCDADFLNPYNDFAFIKATSPSFTENAIFSVNTSSCIEYDVLSGASDVVINVECIQYDIYGSEPNGTGLTVTNNVYFAPSDPRYTAFPPMQPDIGSTVKLAKFGCNVKKIRLCGVYNFLYNDDPSDLDFWYQNLSKPTKTYVSQDSILEYRAKFGGFIQTSSFFYPMVEYPYIYSGTTYKTVETGYTCDGYDKYRNSDLYVSYHGDGSYTKVDSYVGNSIIEYASTDCGYITSKAALTNRTQSGYIPCGSSTTLTQSEIINYPPAKDATEAIIGTCTTNIGSMAFAGSTRLSSVTISYSVTTIGQEAFKFCGLRTITIPNSVTSLGTLVFNGCGSLTSVTLSNNLTSIPNGAFSYCSSLPNITITSGITSIGDSAFYGCSGLTSVTIPNSVASIGNSAFQGCKNLATIEIPNGTIGRSAFSSCTSLSSVTIGANVTYISEGAFKECSAITSVTVNAVTPPTIGYAFDGNYPIYVPCESVSIYKNAKYWSQYSNRIFGIPPCDVPASALEADYSDGTHYIFYCNDNTTLTRKATVSHSTSYTAMTSAVIGSCITNIGESAFENCYHLSSITIPNSVTNIGNSAFASCYSISSVTIPNSVTSIGGGIFSGCGALTTVNIPNSLTVIAGTAFYGCSSLSSITIPNSVTNIGGMAFNGCSGLTSVTIPNSVTNIGIYAFRSCGNLTSIVVEAVTPPTLENNYVFQYTNCPIYVPSGSVNAYKNRWSVYANRIQAIS